MMSLGFRRKALCICAVALLAGCDGAQSPMKAPSGMLPPDAAATRQGLGGLVSPRYTVIYAFEGSYRGTDGAFPVANLTSAHGVLYGTTSEGGTGCFPAGCGTVFAVERSGTERIVHYFTGQPDGSIPDTNLLFFNGALYGTTEEGGTSKWGVAFRITPPGGEVVFHSFDGSGGFVAGGLINVDGAFYGLREDVIYKLTPKGKETDLHTFGSGDDGAEAIGNLVNIKGTLYGVTRKGGSYCPRTYEDGCGTVFSVTTSGVEHVIYSFKGKGKDRYDASYPDAGLTVLNGVLYGTSYSGGEFNRGTVFAVTTSGKESVIYSFNNAPDGYNPEATLTAYRGSLYGTAVYGGTGCYTDLTCGTVFKVTTSGVERILHSFGGNPDGAFPQAGLTVVNDRLYGTTEGGGSCAGTSGNHGCGTVFSIVP